MNARITVVPPGADPTADSTIGDEIMAARIALQAAGARLGARGLIVASEGNLSVRLATDLLLITPAGRRKDTLSVADLIVTSVSSSAADPGDVTAAVRASSDVAIHRAIYEVREDVRAIVHAHVPSALALMIAGDLPDVDVLAEAGPVIGRLPLVPFEAMGTRQLADSVARALSEQSDPLPGAVLLDRHGAIAVGTTLDQALDRMELVDLLCRVWRDARLVSAARGR